MSKDKFIIDVDSSQNTAKNHIINKIDYTVVNDMYDNYDENGIPIIYNFLYKYIKNLSKDKIGVTLSADPCVSASTIAGNAEKYMYSYENESNVKYSSNLKILYFTSTPHICNILNNNEELSVKQLSNSILSDLMCTLEFHSLNDGSDDKFIESISFTKHDLVLSSEQFILIGINDDLLTDIDKELLQSKNITYFTLSQLRKKGFKNILEYVNENFSDNPMHVVFDMSVMNPNYCPCVTRFFEIMTDLTKIDGMSITELEESLQIINKKNIVGLDITGYDLRTDDTNRAYRITCEIAKIVLKYLLDISDKKINVFTENSRFLIWRPSEQLSKTDVGWFILRGMSLDLREELLKKIDSDDILYFAVDDDDGDEQTIYLSSTTMYEQEQKTYYTAENITDHVLFPEEKVHMMFELLNTPENTLLSDKK